jgi:alanine dehydrogenase
MDQPRMAGSSTTPMEQPQMAATTTLPDNFTIGLVANDHDSDETRFFITPEVAGLLISSGITICMESGASSSISYTDENYADYGVAITDRAAALHAEYVLSYAPLKAAEVLLMREGSKLFCMHDSLLFSKEVVEALKERKICLLCLDQVESHKGVPVFANIIDEIDGRGALWYAQEAFTFLGGGKGVLLGGVPGINPCEVVVFGGGTRAMAAVKAATALRTRVTLMDNDMSSLQMAHQQCGDQLMTCMIHPRTLTNKVKSADVLLFDNCTHHFELPLHLKGAVKKDAFILDFNKTSPSLSTPRTVTMAIASCLSNLFMDIELKEGFDNALATTHGLRKGVITYAGYVTNQLVASVVNEECGDLELMLSHSN